MIVRRLKSLFGIVLVILLVSIGLVLFASKPGGSDSVSVSKIISEVNLTKSGYPKCPTNLTGILTAPLMNPENIAALTPLGNVNPPGHTSPVDHIYFQSKETGKIPLYAPANSWITQLTEISYKDNSGKYVPAEYVLSYTICRGLVLTFASYTKFVPRFRNELAKLSTDGCQSDIAKIGHDKLERQCYFKLNYQVKSGDLVGYVQKTSDGKLPFEVWAFNYNVRSRTDIDWAFYKKGSDNYTHSFCLFELYTGVLRSTYFDKFGSSDENGNGFRPRTIEPICGTINQDIVGTIQGMWFGENDKNNGNLEGEGKGLAFIHNNIDPTFAEISVGGNFMKTGVVQFKPAHNGVINREFSEVKADDKVYCYDNLGNGIDNDGGKILVRLVDDHRLNVEHQIGTCSTNEAFQKPFTYYR
jgi:hypothetical protein